MLVGTLEHLGVIHMLAEAMFSVVGDHVRILSMLLIWASGGISVVIDNVPYTAAVIPLVREMAQIGGFDATPLWWSLALGACLGGNGTLVGASANLVMAGIAGKAGVSINFRKFLGRGITVTAVTLAVSTAYVYIRYLM
jgi:Na+/H+ antiporter NhaD/arsenite permease-like protein